jgi:plasmid maintenance system antidote protein VapI
MNCTSVSNNIKKILNDKSLPGFKNMPTREFFIKIGIRQKRWGQIVRNEKAATLDEIGKVSKYFDIPVNMLIDDDSLKQSQQL